MVPFNGIPPSKFPIPNVLGFIGSWDGVTSVLAVPTCNLPIDVL